MKSKSFVPKIIEEDIVITGMSGRFPESDSVDEFADNLYNKVDMITLDDRRWPTDLYGMNGRMGKLKEINKFDGMFFGFSKMLGEVLEPEMRILLETAYEAIVDSGYNPQVFRGSNTGVYIGLSSFGMSDGTPQEAQPDSQIQMTEMMGWIQGTSKCLYPNRLSFVFDFKGPSNFVDTGCSASLCALNTAINDMRLGKCNQAIVAGTAIHLQPFTNNIFQSTNVNAKDGIPKVWDENADGFVRGECVSCLFLQKRSDAKRIYATLLNSGVNIDGHKKLGMFFPSSESQEELMCRVYEEANIDPLEITFMEAHATGTKAGDVQEAKAIYNAYCEKPKRESVLPIGLLKSNIGHTEGASGIAAIVKIILAFEKECIPPCLHLDTIKHNIKTYCPPLSPITDNVEYTPGIASINNFGIGGVNANVLLEPNYKTMSADNERIENSIPRLVHICSRTQEAFDYMCKWIEDNPKRITNDFLDLMSEPMKYKGMLNSSGFPIRGSLIIKESFNESGELKREYKRQSSLFIDSTSRPVWFVFPGLGGQWVGMAKALMPIKIFADKIEECYQILKPYGIDLKHLLLSDDQNSLSSMTNKFCATTSFQLGLIDVLTALNITPDGIIGHSFGEIAAAYADRCINTREAILVTYYRGVVTESDKHIPKGLMAVVGLSWKEAKGLCPKGVNVVCNNGKESVVVSGLYNETKQMIEELAKKGVFVRELQSHDIPYHSPYLKTSTKKMCEELKKHLPNPKPRSKRWVSTAVIESDTDSEQKLASAEYFVHNLISPVYFYNKLKYMPMNAIVIEVGPHPLFSRVVSETLDSSSYISLVKKNSNDSNLDMFFNGIAKLYELGINPKTTILYPKVNYPVVRGTQSISPLMKWDHSENYLVRKWPDYHFKATSSDFIHKINLQLELDTYLIDHTIDDKILFPGTGYLICAWRQMAAYRGKVWNQIPVLFEDVQFRRAVFLSRDETTRLKVRYFSRTGDFEIEESGNTVCVGKIRSPEDYSLQYQNMINDLPKDEVFDTIIEKEDIYKELRIMGYDYGHKFRGLRTVKTNDFNTLFGEVEWSGNIVTFLDSLLQMVALAIPIRKLCVPVMIKQLRCDPSLLYEALKVNRSGIENFIQDDLKEKYELEENLDALGQANESKNIDEYEVNMKEEFHIYKSMITFLANIETKRIVAPGIEVEGWMGLPIPRLSNVQDLKLESYEFIANEDYNSIEESNKKSLLEYLKVCSTIAHKINYTINPIKEELKNYYINEDLIEKYINEQKEEHILLKVLNEIQKQVFDPNQNEIKGNVKEIIKELLMKTEYDLSSDVISLVERNERLIRSLLDIVSENYVPKRDIKVLEINLTNGLMAEEVDNHLSSAAIYPIDVEYSIAVKSMNDINSELKKKFKIKEWDLKQTNFPSDITLTNLVLMKDSPELWDMKMDDFIQEAYDCINPNGFLISVFRYRLTEPESALLQMDGKEVSEQYFTERINEFINKSENIGFNTICRKWDSMASMSILFRKVNKTSIEPKNENIIEISSESEHWFEKVKQKMLEMKESENKEHIWLIGSDTPKNGIIGLINCLRLEPGGETIRCVFNSDENIRLPIDFKEKPYSVILSNDLAVNVIKDGKLGTYRHLTLPKDYDKQLSDEYYLNYTRDISSLQWFSLKNMNTKNETYDLENNKCNLVKCNIYSAGINFKDVMHATGRISSGMLGLFTDCCIGFEFAGRRVDTGERVFGYGMSRCFATSISSVEDFILPIPDNWSMEDSMTILSTYMTVWYGLIERAHIKRGEKVLIHSGAGGVGQAAINVCQYYGCDIFVTVGTEEKKKFLINKYNIPENRIFSSRDIEFKSRITELTKGKGVNIVLNSLTGDKLDASFECLSECGRFVEIGKYDLQLNKQLGMFSFLRDISFIGVSVDLKLLFDKEYMHRFKQWIQTNSNNGMIKPLNRKVFRAEEAEKAFRYMTTGKHIGKLIIKLREEENMRVVVNGYSPSAVLKTTTKTYFDEKKVYIITGGLGGFGLELVHWMLYLGARNFVLTSRTGVKNNYQKFVLDRLKFLGVNFHIYKTQILVSTQTANTTEGTKQLFEESLKLGPIGGVFHLALVLNDCLLENQTIDKFNETIETKVKIFENLDKMSRELYLDLDYFVVFSSLSCGKGNGGQSNYGYANSVCERICELRKRDGLSGQAIQWGPIGDVGVIAGTDMSSLSGIVKQRINSCLEILDKLLQTEKPIVTSFIRTKREVVGETKESRICSQLWQALGIDPKTTPDHLTLGEIGIESMFAVELQQGMKREYDIKISLSDVKRIPVGLLKDFEAGKITDLKKFADDINECRTKLTKIKWIIPSDAVIQLNNVSTGKAVYLLPPMEGLFTCLEPLAEKLDRPAFGLNWPKNMEDMTSLTEISNYFMEVLKSLHPKGDYDIIGHFYGAMIAMKILKKKAFIGRTVIIDMLSDLNIDEEMISDEYVVELILSFMGKDLPQIVRDKIKRDISQKVDTKAKLVKISDEIKEFGGKSLISRDLEEILIHSFNRTKLFLTYRYKKMSKINQMKINIGKKYLEMSGKLLLIKLLEFKNSEPELQDMVGRMTDAYFLPKKGLEEKLDYQVIDANPDSISPLAFDKIAQLINQYLNK